VANYRLTLEYEGTRYHGWQEQQNARSVAGELRRAVQEALGEGNTLKELGGAGRTDAGVHALAQTAHLRLARRADAVALRRAINDRLPSDIHALDLAPAVDAFHARHGALARSYLYQVARRRTALAKRYVWWVKRPLDAGRMAEAAALLPGRHDFRLFCERPAEQPSTVVVLERAELLTAGALILCRLVASHFLWKMVRRLTGALVEVGAGDLPLDAFAALVRAPEAAGSSLEAPAGRRAAPPRTAEWTAPPSGLFLERVLYPGDPPLPPLAATGPVIAVS
jgi:tRNA pseudouridine38-40 synthase